MGTGIVSKKYKNSRILCISDLHAPYTHPDFMAFLEAINKKYAPDRIVCMGDEVDSHAISYHEHDPDLYSSGHELEKAIEVLKPLYDLFPRVDVLDSNHGSLAYRKLRTAGLSRKYMKAYREILEAPKGWTWHDNLTLTMSNGEQVFFHHGLNPQPIRVAQMYGMSVAQGHYHSNACIQYTSSPLKLMFGMNVGCMIDKQSLAFEYNKVTLPRPILSHGIIIDGVPQLLPMPLGKNGRWTGRQV